MTAGGSEGIAVANIYAAFGQVEDMTPTVEASVDLEGVDYLRWLHHTALVAGVDGYLVASRRVGSGEDERWLSRSFPVGDFGGFDDFVEEYGDVNLYARTTLMARPLKHEGERGGAAEPGWLTHYAADIDTLDGKHSATDLPTREQVLTILASMPPVSALIESGGGFYAIWRLDKPYELHTEQQRQRAANIGRRIDETLGGHGFHVDRRSGDLATVTRPPGTVNHKYTPPKFVHLKHIDPEVVYTLDDLDGLLPALPEPEPTNPTPARNSTGGSYADIFAERFTLGDVLHADPVDRWHHVTTTGTEERWRRDGSANTYSLKRFTDTGVVYVHSDSVKARTGTDEGLTLYEFADRLNDTATGQLADMLQYARDEWKRRKPDDGADYIADIESRVVTGDSETPVTTGHPERPTLPDDFWTSRPVLEHIRQEARARRISPAPVLLQVLARLAAITPPSYCVPSLRASKKPMSLGVVIVDDPSAGKSEAASAAAELLGDPPVDVLVDWPVGSGEGIVEAYLEETSEVIDGKKTPAKKQAYRGIHFNIDEGDQLEALSKQQASTLVSNLKTLLMSGGTGTAKADKRQSRRLQKLNYTAGLSISIQPAKAGFLFDDLKGGFPQRLLFATGGDPGRPPKGQRPKPPGPFNYEPLPPLDYFGVIRHHELTFPPEVWEYFDRLAVDAIDGKHGDELDGHAGILTAKTAALLAVLERRTDVTLDDWELAQQIVAYSKAVRTWLRQTLDADNEKREAVATRRAVKRNRALVIDSERRALEAAVRSVARKAARNSGQTLTRSELHSAVASDNRKLVTMDDVIAEAIDRGHIATTPDGRYCLGAKPL